jgi:hypothetical protein
LRSCSAVAIPDGVWIQTFNIKMHLTSRPVATGHAEHPEIRPYLLRQRLITSRLLNFTSLQLIKRISNYSRGCQRDWFRRLIQRAHRWRGQWKWRGEAALYQSRRPKKYIPFIKESLASNFFLQRKTKANEALYITFNTLKEAYFPYTKSFVFVGIILYNCAFEN